MPGTTKIADLKQGDEVIIAYDKQWKLTTVEKRTPMRLVVAGLIFDLQGRPINQSDAYNNRLKATTEANRRKVREQQKEREKKKEVRFHAEEVRKAEKRLAIEKVVMSIRKAKDHNDAVQILTGKLWELQNL
jgi:hypothetical protein